MNPLLANKQAKIIDIKPKQNTTVSEWYTFAQPYDTNKPENKIEKITNHAPLQIL